MWSGARPGIGPSARKFPLGSVDAADGLNRRREGAFQQGTGGAVSPHRPNSRDRSGPASSHQAQAADRLRQSCPGPATWRRRLASRARRSLEDARRRRVPRPSQRRRPRDVPGTAPVPADRFPGDRDRRGPAVLPPGRDRMRRRPAARRLPGRLPRDRQLRRPRLESLCDREGPVRGGPCHKPALRTGRGRVLARGPSGAGDRPGELQWRHGISFQRCGIEDVEGACPASAGSRASLRADRSRPRSGNRCPFLSVRVRAVLLTQPRGPPEGSGVPDRHGAGRLPRGQQDPPQARRCNSDGRDR